MPIDINKPVEKGHDMVLNNPDGTQELGTDKEFAKRKEAGELSGLHTNPAEPASEPVEKANPKEEETVDGDRTDRLDDEQDNNSAEERTEGEVKQTEDSRKESEKAKSEKDNNDKSEKDNTPQR